jgi:hypothetical protein
MDFSVGLHRAGSIEPALCVCASGGVTGVSGFTQSRSNPSQV